MKATPNKNGYALIMVMIAITALSFLAAGFAFSMKVETKLARNTDTDADMMWLGRSGVEKARWLLGQELSIGCEPYDAMNQIWAGGQGSLCSSNGVLAGVSLGGELGDGTYRIRITDLERKANINSATPMELQQAMDLIGARASESSIVVNSILNWINSPNAARVGGADNEYYQSLTPPYNAKHGPIDDMSELLLVKGVTMEMYWGGVSTNHSPAAFQQSRVGRLGPGANIPTFSIGLVNLFTPISSGPININTASTEVLELVDPMIDDNVAARIIEFRNQGEGFESSVPIGAAGKTVPMALAYAGLNPGAVQQLSTYFSVRSATFEVQVDANLGIRKQRFMAILKRNSPQSVDILSFYPVLD